MDPALLQLLSWACLVFSLGMFGTGLSDLRQMFASQSVDNIQFLPFLTTDVKYALQIGVGGYIAIGGWFLSPYNPLIGCFYPRSKDVSLGAFGCCRAEDRKSTGVPCARRSGSSVLQQLKVPR